MMWSITPTEDHIFDPHGDLLLIFSKAEDPPLKDDSENNRGTKWSKMKDEDDDDDQEVALKPKRRRTASKAISRSTEGATTDQSSTLISDSPSLDAKESEAGKHMNLSMLVSSKHLTLASPVFKAMLSTRFKEGEELSKVGKLELPLPDDDAAAFAIILNVIHGRSRRVPKRISLKSLSRICVLIDKYQIMETMETSADNWVKKLEPMNIGSNQNSRILRWMTIAWALNKKDMFETITKIAKDHSGADLADGIGYDLPVPPLVIETIGEIWLFGVMITSRELS